MIKTINLEIKNNLDVKEFVCEFNNLTYDIYYETFNQDLHVALLQCIATGGAITRAFSHRLVYAMIKTADPDIHDFRTFLKGLEDNMTDFTKGWGIEFSTFVLEIFNEFVSVKNELPTN